MHILIAEPRDILRTGLRTIFAEDERISQIYEAATQETLKACLSSKPINLIIINTSMMSNIKDLPRGKFVLLAPEVDIELFLKAYKHGARGFLSENAPAELLRATLGLAEGSFLIEPKMTVPILDLFSGDLRFAVKEELLTPREREIVSLLREGTDRRTIAQDLHISEATLKTHIKNITRKRTESTSLSLPREINQPEISR
ncbi:response regulator transcription factor [Ktedonobacter robiniae]|uniref:DNA-binding response regulator n=1 Tax=Ktedonobacter robiniae TaxID=2778365 RepID=A0ABQ3V560_9CHLR|nr:response regulator transcription factor [Ktedonobacter robiniae]GHO60143.1 DNA-binding response regulator [Ktedonobacter robiniae]